MSQEGFGDKSYYDIISTREDKAVKKRLYIIAIVFIISSSFKACSVKDEQDYSATSAHCLEIAEGFLIELIHSIESHPDYIVTSRGFKYNDTSLSYPHINKMRDETLQSEINLLIFNEIYSKIELAGGWSDTTNLDIEFEIKLLNSKVLSIVYTGVGATQGVAYPFWFFYSTNINIFSIPGAI